MKIYNPFRSHLVRKNNVYLIRKLSFLYWMYKDRIDDFWWTKDEYVEKYCEFDDVLKAKIRLIEINLKNLKVKTTKPKYIRL